MFSYLINSHIYDNQGSRKIIPYKNVHFLYYSISLKETLSVIIVSSLSTRSLIFISSSSVIEILSIESSSSSTSSSSLSLPSFSSVLM